MARVKISEYQAKTLLLPELSLSFSALSAFSSTSLEEVKAKFSQDLVIKVDQGIKKRGKQGLVKVKISAEEAVEFIQTHSKYSQFIIEPFVVHQPESEKYLALERVREGIKVYFGEKGGMDVEENWADVKIILNEFKHSNSSLEQFVQRLLVLFDKYYLSYLEINPLVVEGDNIAVLDLAVEIDDAALNLPVLAVQNLTAISELAVKKSEREVKKLDAQTPASLKYRVINPNGSVWMLLSGGGASLVLADEVADEGFGKELANYGEYSGSPTTEDTYLYTRIILQDMLASRATKKVLIIAGGVANFTDVAKTFAGVIQALAEKAKELKEQSIKIFVRRGGPNQAKGLGLMKDFLEKAGLLGVVLGPDKPITDVISLALKAL